MQHATGHCPLGAADFYGAFDPAPEGGGCLTRHLPDAARDCFEGRRQRFGLSLAEFLWPMPCRSAVAVQQLRQEIFDGRRSHHALRD